MICEVIDIEVEGYNLMESAKLYCYRLDNTQSNPDKKRPAIVVIPGGGYEHLSDRESEPIAMQYLAAGFHAFVLHYHCAPAQFPVQLLELAKVVQLLRVNAKDWMIDENKIVVNGFSAGGHLAASLGVFWNQTWLLELLKVKKEEIQPNGCILAYPVITSKEYAHRRSFEMLLGDSYAKLEDKVSLEDCVTKDTPPMFLWHTYTDGSVPVENSLLFIMALRKHNISTEFHMYPLGGHGLALANEETKLADGRGIQAECQNWMDMATRWVSNLGGLTC